MTTETLSQGTTTEAARRPSLWGALQSHLRDYGLLLVLMGLATLKVR